VDSMTYIDSNGEAQTLNQDVDFILDRITEPSRIFPPVGQYWPADLYVANAVQILYTAGYDPDPTAVATHTVVASPPNQQPSSTIVSGVPGLILLGILNLVAYWWQNRGAMGEVPDNIANIFAGQAVIDFAPTRG
jgi:hypothetical protein